MYICMDFFRLSMKDIFDNTQVAFALKSNAELRKAYLLFKMMSYPHLVKISAGITKALLKLRFPIKGLIKKTIFNQFCGGVTKEDCLFAVQQIHDVHVRAILDYSVEGKETEQEFDKVMQQKIELITFAQDHPEIVFAVMKPTALGRFSIWQRVSERSVLTPAQEEEWKNVVFRVNSICKKAFESNVPLLIDAEESWMQDAADDLALQMMENYNKEQVIIYNTIQCYRHDRLAYTKALHEKAQQEGFKIGAKIVRGAYMEKENERAAKQGYKTPICANKAATDDNFDTVLRYIIAHSDDFSLFVGSHNEESNYLTLQLMEEYGIKKDDHRIWFGQLYGMSDHLSFNLGKEGYNTVKLIPFGPVEEVIPYLIRRAEENTSVAGQTGRELSLIKQERQRRKRLNTTQSS